MPLSPRSVSLSRSKRLLVIIWPFIAIVVLLVALANQSIAILSAGRAFVEGESLWSKAQKQSLVHLMRYAHTHAESDYQNFRAALAVPLGDQKARLELEKSKPDYAVAYQGFLEGRNHPDDIPGMIDLYRRFRHLSYIDRAITLWADGDRSIGEFTAVAEELHARISAGQRDPDKLYGIVERIFAVDARLTPEEDAFSASLGEATRQTKLLLSIATIVLAGTLVPLGVMFSRRMLKQGENVEQALRLSEERFNLAVAGSNDGIWDWNITTDEIYYSPRFSELLGHTEQPIEGTVSAFLSRLHPEDVERTVDHMTAHLEDGALYDIEYRLKTKAGAYRWFRARGRSVRDGSGQPIRMAGSLTDITDRKHAESELFSAKERAQVTLQSIGDGVVVTDTRGLIEYMNPVAESLTGCSMAHGKGLPFNSLVKTIDEKSKKRAPDPVEIVLRRDQTLSIPMEIAFLRPDGMEIAVSESAAPIRDSAGEISGVVLVFRDVSHERQYAAKLSYQASHDALTGLINRREFEHRLGRLQSGDGELQHALMYLDLDQFKVVNDTCGHAAGDELMRQVSALLQRRLREGDTLARLGGDEFGALLQNCTADNALRLAEELRRTVNEHPFIWQARSFSIGVSIGVVNLGNEALTLAEMLSAADSACYMAKEKGRNRVQVYHRDDADISGRKGQMEWVGRIQEALEQNRFCLYAQQIVPIGTAELEGTHLELLVRMIDEQGQLVSPMAFIPAAERYNLMPAIDRWVIRTAFCKLAEMRHAGQWQPDDLCAINISGATLGDEGALQFVMEQFAQSGIAYSSICFEITETAAISIIAKAARFMHELRELGCKFSLDDFGAGMSSFAYLKHLPVDFLKIDGAFVKDMATDPIDAAMVEAINRIGHVMGKRTIAEFVESQDVLAALRRIGVDYAQGYGIAKPAPFHPGLDVVPFPGKLMLKRA
jgi:diguanylate cyclase (GGDEF)-like protein/PAS domain S-box-containing protein